MVGGALFVKGTFAAGIVLVWVTRWSKDKKSDKENGIAEKDIQNGGFTNLSDDSNNSNEFYSWWLDINGLLSTNEEKNNFDESVEGKQWFKHIQVTSIPFFGDHTTSNTSTTSTTSYTTISV